MITTMAVLGEIPYIDKKDLKRFENVWFKDENQFFITSNIDRNFISLMTLSDFVDMVNDEKFNPNKYWVSYIQIGVVG